MVKKILKYGLLVVLSLCLVVELYMVHSFYNTRQEQQKHYVETTNRLVSCEQIFKVATLAELKLVSALNSESNMDVVPDAANALSYYERYSMFMGDWTLTESKDDDESETSVYMDCKMEFDQKTQNFVLNIYDGTNIIVQSVVFDFRNMNDFNDVDDIPDSFGEFGNPLNLLKTSKVIIPQFAYFGLWKGDCNQMTILTNHYKHLKYRLVRPEPDYGG